MKPSIRMILGMEKTEKQRTAGMRVTSDRHSDQDSDRLDRVGT